MSAAKEASRLAPCGCESEGEHPVKTGGAASAPSVLTHFDRSVRNKAAGDSGPPEEIEKEIKSVRASRRSGARAAEQLLRRKNGSIY
jgi:hypothetical protein